MSADNQSLFNYSLNIEDRWDINSMKRMQPDF